MDDPFAVLDAPKSEPAAVVQVTGDVPSGGVFVFDLETVPDESRFPRPVKVEKVKRPDAVANLPVLCSQTVPAIKAKIPSLSESQLAELATLEGQSSKPRSGVLDAIADQQKTDNADDHEAAMMKWRELAFSPLCCRVVALGIKSQKHRVTMLAKTADEERELLRVLWLHVQRFRTRCGYNITEFDDAVLIFRSMILNVDATEKIQRKKYSNAQAIDLYTSMFPSPSYGGKKKEDEAESPYQIMNGKSRKLKEVCRMLGIVPPVGYEMSGDKVFDLVEAGQWDDVAAYVSSDADIEFDLYSRLSDYVMF